MYVTEGPVRFAPDPELLAALRPVADAVRKKKYHTPDGEPKPAYYRVELNLSVAECQRIMRLVDEAGVARLAHAA